MKELKLSSVDRERIEITRKQSLEKIYSDNDCLTLIKEYNLSEDFVLENASKFLRVIEEKDKCFNCKSLKDCKNQIKGVTFKLSFDEDDERLDFLFYSCEFGLKKLLIDSQFIIRDFPEEYLSYPFKEILNDDYKNVRAEVCNYLTRIVKNDSNVGIYLYGGRLIGKTFILSLFLKAMSTKKNQKAAFVDTPKMVQYLNGLNFSNKDEFNHQLDIISNVDLLVLDDFGNEYKNEFIRDTIIYPLLNERLKNGKLTCFGSCYSINEIMQLYSLKEKNSPKANQIIALINALSKSIELKSEPFRN